MVPRSSFSLLAGSHGHCCQPILTYLNPKTITSAGSQTHTSSNPVRRLQHSTNLQAQGKAILFVPLKPQPSSINTPGVILSSSQFKLITPASDAQFIENRSARRHPPTSESEAVVLVSESLVPNRASLSQWGGSSSRSRKTTAWSIAGQRRREGVRATRIYLTIHGECRGRTIEGG